jgi:hypothetical protein
VRAEGVTKSSRHPGPNAERRLRRFAGLRRLKNLPERQDTGGEQRRDRGRRYPARALPASQASYQLSVVSGWLPVASFQFPVCGPDACCELPGGCWGVRVESARVGENLTVGIVEWMGCQSGSWVRLAPAANRGRRPGCPRPGSTPELSPGGMRMRKNTVYIYHIPRAGDGGWFDLC